MNKIDYSINFISSHLNEISNFLGSNFKVTMVARNIVDNLDADLILTKDDLDLVKESIDDLVSREE